MYLNWEYKYSKCIKYNVLKLITMDIPSTYIIRDTYIKLNYQLEFIKKTPNTAQFPSSCNSSLYIDKNIANPHSTFAPCII